MSGYETGRRGPVVAPGTVVHTECPRRRTSGSTPSRDPVQSLPLRHPPQSPPGREGGPRETDEPVVLLRWGLVQTEGGVGLLVPVAEEPTDFSTARRKC